MQASLQVSVVLTVLCAPSSTLSVSISSFSLAASLFSLCEGLSSYLPLHIICLLLCLFSLAVSPSFLVSFPALSDCYTVKPVHFYTLAITLGQWRDCRLVHTHCSSMPRPKTGIRGDSTFSDLLLKKHLIMRFCFQFSFMFFSVRQVVKDWLGWVVLICVPWYVWMRSHILHKHLVNQHRQESQGWI